LTGTSRTLVSGDHGYPCLSSTERFDTLDLAQTAAKTTLDTIVARLDVLHTMLTELQKDDGDRRDCTQRVLHHSGNNSFATIKFKLPLYNGKYDPAAYLD
jgi:hypothetical protein